MRAAGVSLLLMIVVPACRQEDPLRVTDKINPKAMPTMTTHDVMTVISDSGVPQYRMVCPVWYVYDDIDTPLWILPRGPYLEKFDPLYNIVFTVAADSAVNNRITQRWHLYGNVEFNESPDLLILTPELVWDQREQMIYSDSFIHIEQPDKVIEGYGFVGYTNSRGALQSYELRRPTAVLPYDKEKFPGAGGGMTPGAVPAGLDPSVLADPQVAAMAARQGQPPM